MIALALDVGTKRIGMAFSDPKGLIAFGLPTLERKDFATDLAAIEDIVSKRKVEVVVLGWPLHMSGEIGTKAQEILAFRDDLKTKLNIPIELMDERWSTVEAERTLLEGDLSRKKRKSKIDQVAAQIILQKYLESRCVT